MILLVNNKIGSHTVSIIPTRYDEVYYLSLAVVETKYIINKIEIDLGGELKDTRVESISRIQMERDKQEGFIWKIEVMLRE